MVKKQLKSDVIIIGAGISGLLTALALTKEGKKVIIIEKSKILGGNARSYDISGFRVDTGVHAITSTNEGPLFELVEKYFDKKPKYLPHGEYYIRTKDKLVQMPWTINEWRKIDIFPQKDKLIMLGLLTKNIVKTTITKKESKESVYDVIKIYSLTDNSMRFIDMLCYLLTGESMRETPAWRITKGAGYISENKIKKIEMLYMIKNLFRFNGSTVQGYPKGGIGTITNALIKSIPIDKIQYLLEEQVTEIITKNNKAIGVETEIGTYKANTIVYSGFMKDLPNLTDSLPQDFKNKLKKIKQTESLTIWLGLKKPLHWFNYKGSEMWYEDGEYFWAMPVSNYDLDLAPGGMQLVGFTFIIKGDKKEFEKKAEKTIYKTFPGIEKQMAMKHIQITIPEKAAITKDTFFPNPKSPIDNLYLVGTDTDYRSMGLTRAAYSVIEALNYMRQDNVITNDDKINEK
ncbi:MAG: NAD(P)/FAD-dependent oxidoreductase [DPANN group archaeon]|nr:NAD(P)/FAD-dependent oxidoreductase [DPANN group archaeon]